MKSKIIYTILTIVTAFALASCSSNTIPTTQVQDENSTTSTSQGKKLSITIWDTFQKPGLEQIFADFTKETGIQTEVQVVKWDEYWTMLEAGAQGGSLPDVFWMHSNESQRYMSNDMLLDLTDKIKANDAIDLNNYPKDIVELYTYNDHVYGIPKDIDTIALWYNKKMFDEAGIPYPDETWTWDTFKDVSKKLTKPDGSQYGTAIRSSNNQDGYFNIIYDFGGYVISDDKKKSGFDDPNTIRAMEYVYSLVQDGSMPSSEVMAENDLPVLFQSGKVAMIMQGSWMLSAFKENDYVRENCDVAVLPMDATTQRRASIYNGLGWAASANGKNTEEAWKLLSYLGSEAAQKRQAELGITMSAYKNTSDPWVNSSKEFNLNAYLTMMNDMIIYPHSKNTIIWEPMSRDTFLKAWTGEITIADACKEITQKMDESLSQE